jgi:hypothetical protein
MPAPSCWQMPPADDLRHFRILTLLGIAVTLTMPTFADSSPNPDDRNATKSSPIKSNGWSVDNPQVQVGAENPAPKSNVNRTKVSPALGAFSPIRETVTLKNPRVTDPCKTPDPPQ